jgi:rhodanese-related sulfurtransferase
MLSPEQERAKETHGVQRLSVFGSWSGRPMIRRLVRRWLDDRKPAEPPVAPAPAAPEDDGALSVGEVIRTLDRHTIADVRHPRDWAMGVIPGAVRAPNGDQVAGITVLIDQIGADAPEIAERLGVPWIRGGFAAWLEEGGPIEPPPRLGKHQVGDIARLRGKDGWIRDIVRERDRVDVTLWFEDGPAAERVPGDSLDG